MYLEKVTALALLHTVFPVEIPSKKTRGLEKYGILVSKASG